MVEVAGDREESVQWENRVSNPRGREIASPPSADIEALYAVSLTRQGETEFNKSAATISNTASTIKMLTAYTVRQTISDGQLENIIEVIEDDTLEASSANLEAGDLITYRDALHALLLPSGNDAAWCMARHVGEILSPGHSDPAARFVEEMNTIAVNKLGWSGHYIPHPAGRAQASPRQISELALTIYEEEPLLTEIMGKSDYDILVTGPNARVHTVSHTMKNYQDLIPGLIGGKTGTGTTWAALSTLWVHPDGEVRATTILRSVREYRVSDMTDIVQSLSPANVFVKSFPLDDPKFKDPERNSIREGDSDPAWSIQGDILRANGGEGDGYFRIFPTSGTVSERTFPIEDGKGVRVTLEYRWRGTGSIGDAFRVRWGWATDAGDYAFSGWQGVLREEESESSTWSTFSQVRSREGYQNVYIALQLHDGELTPGSWLEVRNIGISGPGVVVPQDDPDLSYGADPEGSTMFGYIAPAPSEWTANDGGGVLYYSQTRDALAFRVEDSAGWSVMTGTPQGPSTSEPATYLTHIVDSTADASLNIGAQGASPTSSESLSIPAGGGVMRWHREEGVNTGTNFRPIRFPSSSAAADAVGETFYFRALLVEGKYDGDWFDGDTPDINIDEGNYSHFQWDGEPHKSTSTKTGRATDWGHEVVWENFVENAGFASTSGWYLGSSVDQFVRTDEWAQFGEYSSKLVLGSTSGVGTAYAMRSTPVDVTAGQWLGMSVRIKSGGGGDVWVRPSFRIEDANGSFLTNVWGGWVLAGDVPEELTLTHEVEEGEARVQFSVYWSGVEGAAGQPVPEGAVLFTNGWMGVKGTSEAHVLAQVAAPFNETFSPDPDLTPQVRPGGGSRLVGKGVTGLSAANGVIVQSSAWSKSRGVSARLIRTTDSGNTFARVTNLPVVPQTIVAWRYQNEVLTPRMSSFGRIGFGTNSPLDLSEPAPNEPGETLLYCTREENQQNRGLLTGHFTDIGGSVWYDLVTVADEPDYDGPPFSGSSPTEGPKWLPGSGNSGCKFVGNPTWIANSGVNGGQIGYAATLKEVGDWQQ